MKQPNIFFSQVLEDEDRNPSRQGGEDVQILRLDEDTRREETYKRVGDSEILSLDHNSLQQQQNISSNDRGNVVRAEVEIEDKSPG